MKDYKKNDHVLVDNQFEAIVLEDQSPGGTAIKVSLLNTAGIPDGYDYEIELERCQRSYKIGSHEIAQTFPILKMTKLAEEMEINPSLLRHYITGDYTPSEKRRKEIEDALHRIGKELCNTQIR